MKIKIKWSPAFMGCFGTVIGGLPFLGSVPSRSFWTLEAIVFGIFLISGLVHGHLKWKRQDWMRRARELLDMAEVK